MSGNRVVIQEGYSVPFADFEGYRKKRRKSGGKRRSSSKAKAWQQKFAAASRACRGMGKTARKACMRRKLKR